MRDEIVQKTRNRRRQLATEAEAHVFIAANAVD